MIHKDKGIYLAVLTAFISGISIFINKFAVGIIKPPIVFTSVKNFGVGVFIISFVLLSKKWKLVKLLNKKQGFLLFLIGLIGGSIPFYLFFTGLALVPAINAAIIQKTLVIWVSLLAVPFLREKMSKGQLLGVTALFLSNVFIGGFKGFTFSKGEFYVLAATLFWAIEIILAKKVLADVDADIVTASRMGFGSVILIVAAAFTAPTPLKGVLGFSPTQWFWMLVTAFALFAYVSSWYRALKFAPAVVVTSILVASTLVTNLLSAIFVTHNFNLIFSLQTAVTVTGTGIFILSSKKKLALI